MILKMNPIFIFVFLIANISALVTPEETLNTADTRNARLITNIISKAIHDASQAVKGADPISINKKHVKIGLPVPLIFNAEACFKDILVGGFSNIVVHKLSHSIIRSRLDFDIELPLIYVYGATTFKATLFGRNINVEASGNIEIHRIRCIGQIQFNIFSSTIRSISIKFTLGGIDSDVEVVIGGNNYSSYVNYFIGTTIPNTITEYSPHVNELLSIILMNSINANL